MQRLGRLTAVLCVILAIGTPAQAQTQEIGPGIRTLSSLSTVVKHYAHIAALRVQKADRARRTIQFEKVANLKGKSSDGSMEHVVRQDDSVGSLSAENAEALLSWAQPGKIAVMFHNGINGIDGLVCIGNLWYTASSDPSKPSQWEVGFTPIGLSRCYVGSAAKLKEFVSAILVGQEVIVTAEAEEAISRWSDQSGVYRDWLRGKKGRVCRLKASHKITEIPWTDLDESPYFVGWGVGGPEVVPALVAALRDGDEYARAEAAEDLGQLGTQAQAAVHQLRRALRERDAFVRVHAALALARIEPEGDLSLAPIVEVLQHGEAAGRRAAAAALGELGPRSRPASPALIVALGDEDVGVRQAAALALGEVALQLPRDGAQTGKEVAALARLLQQDPDHSTRYRAAEALRKFGAEAQQAVPALEQALRADHEVAGSAADILLRLSPPRVDVLAAALADPACAHRATLAAYLGELGPKARGALPALLGMLKEEDSDLQLQAAYVLLNIDRPLTARPVRALLTKLLIDNETLDGNQEVILRVLRILAEVGADGDSVPALANILSRQANSLVPRLQHPLAIQALTMARPAAKAALPALRAALKDDKTERTRVHAALALWRLQRDREALDLLIGIMKSSRKTDSWIASWVAEQLAESGAGADAALPVLRDLLEQTSGSGRPALALALWRLQGCQANLEAREQRRQTLDLLLKMLRQDDATVRFEALDAVASVGPEARAAVPQLVKALQEDAIDVRQRAVAALGSLAPQTPEAAAPLCWALKDQARVVRLEAVKMLSRLGRRHPQALPVVARALERELTSTLQEETVLALGRDGRPLVPVLLRALRHENREVYQMALKQLRAIDPLAEARVWGVPGVSAVLLPWENLSPGQLETLWQELASTDPPRADRAFWTLRLAGDEALPFLRRRLPPIRSADPEQVARLIGDLGSERFAARHKANTALEKLADAAAPALQKARAGNPPLEVRRRLERLLERLDPDRSPERRSALQALTVLEQIGTKAARQVLVDIAGGLSEARLTQEAQAALSQLRTRVGAAP